MEEGVSDWAVRMKGAKRGQGMDKEMESVAWLLGRPISQRT